jgi:pyruvate/oxaloacetate carboxyltransferase
LEAERDEAFTRMDRIKSAHIVKELDSLMEGNNSIVNKTAKKLCVQEFIVNYISKNGL